MRLSHITLHGFKSFAKKTTLDVTHQVTGVVGPNGSGKSNVAEAIRFVLGEQSMKSMRGKQGADLIFKGSNMLPGMSRASVTMVIDNRDNKGEVTPGSLFDAPEFYSGFWIIEAETEEQGHQLAMEGSRACNRKVELRPYIR